ncbi:hypothetical protein LguiA_016919 [Lonicera macranthoides]
MSSSKTLLSMSSSKTLLSLLNAGEERPFDEIVSDFLSEFPSSLHFTLCQSLTILLEVKLMLRSAQRLVAFAILHQAYSSQQASANPFIVHLVNAACDDQAEKYERAFILQLLGSSSFTSSKEFVYAMGCQSSATIFHPFACKNVIGNIIQRHAGGVSAAYVQALTSMKHLYIKTYEVHGTGYGPGTGTIRHGGSIDERSERGTAIDFAVLRFALTEEEDTSVLKQSAADYIRLFDPLLHAFPQHEHLQQQYCNKIDPEPFKCLFRDTSVTNVVADPDVSHGCDPNSPEFDLHPGVKPKIGTGDRNKSTIELLQNLSLGGLGPRPPRLPVQDSELVWLNPDNSHELLWDYGMCCKDDVKYLIAKALTTQLTFAEHQVHVYKINPHPFLFFLLPEGNYPMKTVELA